MAVKIRLQRKGRKKAPFYYIVVADARSPRDGKFIERLGSFNPIPQIPQIDIDTDKAVNWLNLGAIPTKTVKNLLSAKGVMYRKHLLRGVKMGIMTLEEADVKFNEYIASKVQDEETLIKKLEDKKNKDLKQALARETEINAKRAEDIMAKRKAAIAAASKSDEDEIEEDVAEEEVATEVTEEEVVTDAVEESVEEATETVVEEAPVAEATTEEATETEEAEGTEEKE